MEKKEELTQIVMEVQKNSSQFELLYSQIINKVYFWCYTIANDETVAKDMAQEAMILIYDKIHTLKHPENFTSWMYRLVRNSCINYLRANKRYKVEFPYSEDFNDGFETNIMEERYDNLPEEAYYQKETKALIRSFIDKLPRRQREIITLYYLEELKTTEIAETLNYPVGSVRSRLHAGRKSLEKQIKEYQDKHNTKLYSASVLPLLGLILKEYQSDICRKQNLQYDKNLYNAANASAVNSIVHVLFSKFAIIITSVICISVITLLIVVSLQNHSTNVVGGKGFNDSKTNDLEMFNKSKKNPYIKDISYLLFPMREGVNVTIELKQDMEESDMKILLNDKELSFKKYKQDILLHATENGTYTIIIDEHKTSFRIDNIDSYAPELVEAFNEDGYLQLVVNDELSLIDYDNSYVEYQGQKYVVPKSLIIQGEFNGLVDVIIVHQEGYKIIYGLDFK